MTKPEVKCEPKKRVNIVSLQLVKESSLLYGPRRITNTRLAYELFAPYLKEKDREHLYVVGLNTKKEPTFLNLTSIGTINQAIAVPRDILNTAILAVTLRLATPTLLFLKILGKHANYYRLI